MSTGTGANSSQQLLRCSRCLRQTLWQIDEETGKRPPSAAQYAGLLQLDELLARSPTRNDALWSDALEARQFAHALAGLLLAESRPDRRTQTPVKLDSQHALRRYWLWAFLNPAAFDRLYEGLAKQLPYRLSHWPEFGDDPKQVLPGRSHRILRGHLQEDRVQYQLDAAQQL